ncbi:hypothetical protein BHM03_00010438, partial [Ensete ventricosum]
MDKRKIGIRPCDRLTVAQLPRRRRGPALSLRSWPPRSTSPQPPLLTPPSPSSAPGRPSSPRRPPTRTPPAFTSRVRRLGGVLLAVTHT